VLLADLEVRDQAFEHPDGGVEARDVRRAGPGERLGDPGHAFVAAADDQRLAGTRREHLDHAAVRSVARACDQSRRFQRADRLGHRRCADPFAAR
jgi:hypothetical protein